MAEPCFEERAFFRVCRVWLEAIIAMRWAYFTVFAEFTDFFMLVGQMVFATFRADQDIGAAEIGDVAPLLALVTLWDSMPVYPSEAGTPFAPERSVGIHQFFTYGPFIIVNN